MELSLFLINFINLVISLGLTFVCFKAYRSFKLKIFRRAWFLIFIASIFWLIGHFSILLNLKGPPHWVPFTIFIILLVFGIYYISVGARLLGGI